MKNLDKRIASLEQSAGTVREDFDFYSFLSDADKAAMDAVELTPEDHERCQKILEWLKELSKAK